MGFWILIIPLVLIVAIGVVKLMPSEGKKGFRDDVGFGESVMIIIGSFVIAGGFVGTAIIAGIVLLIVTAIADWVTDDRVQTGINKIESTITGNPMPEGPPAACDFKDRMSERGSQVTEEWMSATICETDGMIGFFATHRMVPEVRYRDSGDVVLEAIPIQSFVQIRHSTERPGGVLNYWHMFVMPDGFDRASVDSVELAIRARPN